MSTAPGRGGRGRPAGGNRAREQTSKRPGAAAPRWFSRVAGTTATAMGTPWAFLIAAGIILAWAISGPLFHFSDTWQLVINTGTTIVTFLMVFLIQNTQNRDARALHLKLDELLRAVEAARTDLIDIEEDSDQHLEHLQQAYRALKERAQGTAPPALQQPDDPSR